jgi:NAD(P)H dehydrogenase (quinone)
VFGAALRKPAIAGSRMVVDPRSLNGALKDYAVQHLQAAGHIVQVSDLYIMQWKPTLEANETPGPEVLREQEKLLWADTVIFQFPLCWFSMPAIMKGWVERVFTYGFGYGIGEHSDLRWGDRYGEGTLAGKRAMLMVTAGGWEPHYSARDSGSIRWRPPRRFRSAAKIMAITISRR